MAIYQTKRDIVLKLWGCVDLRSGRVIGYIKKNDVTIACGGRGRYPVTIQEGGQTYNPCGFVADYIDV